MQKKNGSDERGTSCSPLSFTGVWDFAFPVFFYRCVGLRVPRLFLPACGTSCSPFIFNRRVGLRVPRQPTCGTSCSPSSFIGMWDFVFPVFLERRVGLRVPRLLLLACGTSCSMFFFPACGTSCSPCLIFVWDFVSSLNLRVGLRVPHLLTGVWDFVFPVFFNRREGIIVSRLFLLACGISCSQFSSPK